MFYPKVSRALRRRDLLFLHERLKLAGFGHLAHLTPGEIILPEFLQTPELLSLLRQAAAANNIPFDSLRIGSRKNRINPNAGLPEFEGSYDGFTDNGESVTTIGSPYVDSGSFSSPGYDEVGAGRVDTGGGGGSPVVIDGPPTEGITVTGKPLPKSRTQAKFYPTINGAIIGGDDFGSTENRPVPHNGVDLCSRPNQPIRSVVGGKVVEIGKDSKSGNYITIRDASGNLYGYAHTRAVGGLKVGQDVAAGSQIGFTNGSGEGTGPHLHFTYRPGTPDAPATRGSRVEDPNLIFEDLGWLGRP